MGKRQDIPPVEESDENHLLFYGRRHLEYYEILKLDLNRDFSKFSLKRCRHQQVSSPLSVRRMRRRSRNWASSMVGRCNRHLRIRHKSKSKSRQRQLLSRMDRVDIQLKNSPNPFFEIHCTAHNRGFPEEFAMAASGSKLYLFGGYYWTGKNEMSRNGMVLPRDVYYIDATADSGETVKMSCQMNSGKRSPLAWSVAGKIYVLPGTFAFGEVPGHFECFDPESGSWTILASPPFLDLSIPPDWCGRYPLPLFVRNNILLGSNLVISTNEPKHYSFDTAQPTLGWRPVSLSFGSSELDFLPFDPLTSVPLGDTLIYSYVDSRSFRPPNNLFIQSSFIPISHVSPVPAGEAEKSFLKSLNIGHGHSYVSRFEYDAHRLRLSIKPVRGIAGMVKWGEYVKFGGPFVGVVGMGDGLVMFVKSGFDRFNIRMRSSFNLFRIQEEADRYVASNVSSALFIPPVTSHFSSFVMKDGTFT